MFHDEKSKDFAGNTVLVVKGLLVQEAMVSLLCQARVLFPAHTLICGGACLEVRHKTNRPPATWIVAKLTPNYGEGEDKGLQGVSLISGSSCFVVVDDHIQHELQMLVEGIILILFHSRDI